MCIRDRAVEAHGIADAETVLDRHCAAERERAVPAHRIARDGDDIIGVAIDAEEVEYGCGVDQRRCDVAAHMRRNTKAVGAVEVGHRRLIALAALRIEIGDEIAEARAVQPGDAAKLAFAIGAAARRDDERSLARCLLYTSRCV